MILILCMQVGDESYDSYFAEKDKILSSLARRAKVRLTKSHCMYYDVDEWKQGHPKIIYKWINIRLLGKLKETMMGTLKPGSSSI